MIFLRKKTAEKKPQKPSGLSKRLDQFAKDERGTNAIEFVLAAPLFLGLMFGMTTILSTENVTTQGGKVSATVADIIAQSTVVNRDVVDATLNAGQAIMGARSNMLQVWVAGIEIDNNGRAEVIWSRGKNLTSLQRPAPGSEYPLPAELLANPGFVVTAKSRITHKPLISSEDSWSYWGNTKINAGTNEYDYENSYVPREDLTTHCGNC